jgi:DNA polymerase alpha subunit A
MRLGGANDAPLAHDDDDGNFIGGMDDDDVPMSDPAPSSPVQKAVERKAQVAIKAEEEDDYDAMEVAQADGIAAFETRPIPNPRKLFAHKAAS